MRSRNYLSEWDTAGCGSYCDGVMLVKEVIKENGDTTRNDSRTLLKEAREHMEDENNHCDRLATGQCELARFFINRSFGQIAFERELEKI